MKNGGSTSSAREGNFVDAEGVVRQAQKSGLPRKESVELARRCEHAG